MALAFCTLASIQDVLSADGVTLRLDDSPPSTYADVIDEASQYVNFYLWERYTEATLNASLWVKHVAKTVAAMMLCERRGNPVPVGVLERFGRYQLMLEAIQGGKAKVPGAALRKSSAPVMSNMSAVNRPYPRAVVEKLQSTGTPEGYTQNRDPLEATQQVLNFSI